MLETKPGQAVSIIECDMNVSFYRPNELDDEIWQPRKTELVNQNSLC